MEALLCPERLEMGRGTHRQRLELANIAITAGEHTRAQLGSFSTAAGQRSVGYTPTMLGAQFCGNPPVLKL